MSSREKNTLGPSPTSSIEPKKSVRLAQKRKLREESGPCNSSEDDFYFTPYHTTKSSSPIRPKSQTPTNISCNSPSLVTLLSSPTKKFKGKSVLESLADTSLGKIAPLPAPSKVYSPSQKPSKLVVGSISTTTIASNNSNNNSIRLTSSEDSNSSLNLPSTSTSTPSPSASKKKNGKPNTSNSASAKEEVLEEEKWLNALEAGKLEELDEELKQMKNPKLMTARQRAMLGKKDKDIYGFSIEEDLTSLNLFGKEKEKLVITQEMIKLRAEKTEKRRQMAQEKKEIDKKKTMDRLLKKQQSKALKGTTKPKGSRKLTDYKITFISKPEGNIISFPVDYPLPFSSPKLPRTSTVVSCGVEGCSNPKKYSCAKTGVPLCSLGCYKLDLYSVHSSCCNLFNFNVDQDEDSNKSSN